MFPKPCKSLRSIWETENTSNWGFYLCHNGNTGRWDSIQRGRCEGKHISTFFRLRSLWDCDHVSSELIFSQCQSPWCIEKKNLDNPSSWPVADGVSGFRSDERPLLTHKGNTLSSHNVLQFRIYPTLTCVASTALSSSSYITHNLGGRRVEGSNPCSRRLVAPEGCEGVAQYRLVMSDSRPLSRLHLPPPTCSW